MQPDEAFAQWADVDAGLLRGNGWEFVGYHVEGKLAAVGAIRGHEIHFAIDPAWRGRLITRRTIREYLGPLLESKGFLTTRVMQDDLPKAYFIERMGFVRTTDSLLRSGVAYHYMLPALPYGKEN